MNLKDNQKRAKQTLWIFYIFLGFWGLNSLIPFVIVRLINDSTVDILMYFNMLNYLNQLLNVLCVILFIRWFHRAYYNLHQLNLSLSYTEGWAAGSWFVPLLNFFTPYLIMEEIWKYTQIKAKHKSLNSTLIIKFWWLTFIINFLLVIGFLYLGDIHIIHIHIHIHLLTAISNLVSLIGLLLIIRIVKQIAYWENIIYTNESGMAIEDHLLDMD